MFVAVTQTGVDAEQSAAVAHCTHVFVVVSHAGVAPEQSLFAAHCTQAPFEQTSEAGHSELASHIVEHIIAVVQNSLGGQSAFDAHASELFEFELELEHARGTATSATSDRYCGFMFPSPFESRRLLHNTRTAMTDGTCRPGATRSLGTSVSMRDLDVSRRID
ncbi:MAG TPA: hypothetical protein VH143_32490 [Kofleriaceae bacterium]|jgi:hypothetical protein|nr:hypothetical protein [Kofleriaceae bacterium]